MNLRRILVTAAVVLGLASAIAPAEAQKRAAGTRKATPAAAARAEKLASVEGITEYRLANGMSVLLFPDPSSRRPR
jgi:zinc protease